MLIVMRRVTAIPGGQGQGQALSWGYEQGSGGDVGRPSGGLRWHPRGHCQRRDAAVSSLAAMRDEGVSEAGLGRDSPSSPERVASSTVIITMRDVIYGPCMASRLSSLCVRV